MQVWKPGFLNPRLGQVFPQIVSSNPAPTTSAPDWGLTTREKVIIYGGLILGTGISGLISYFGIKAGVEEKGFLKVLGWVLGIPASLSTLVGAGSLATLAVKGPPRK